MLRIGSFEKVSPEQFVKDWTDTFGQTAQEAGEIYSRIKLPRRGTSGSAGYDFFSPAPFAIGPGETVKIPTGIRVRMEEGWVLACFPRSGLGFKYRLQLDNTVGIIDSDYCFSDNEGHIFCKLTNDSRQGKALALEEGMGFMQGIFLPFGITLDDNVSDRRNGGFGSTSVKRES